MGALLATVLAFAAPARAAFPGRNGLLAVQPLSGPGIVLVQADGRGERRVCAQSADPCGVAFPSSLLRPQWAADGGALVINQTEGPFEVIYPDGSCLDCLGPPGNGGWADVAFTSNPTLLTAVTATASGGVFGSALVQYGIDGLERRVLLSGAPSDPVWSSRDELALVRGGWISVGVPAKLRPVAQGSAPSWSPDGKQIVFVRRGWLLVSAVRGRRFRRLVRGAAPAWSPDGRRIAFFDQRHRLSVVPAGGGRVRGVRGVSGWAVDWQPLGPTRPSPCQTPPGSTVVATSDTAIITDSHGLAPSYPYPPGSATLGCLRAEGRERVLSSAFSGLEPGYATSVGASDVALAGSYAAFAGSLFSSHDQAMQSFVSLFDLRTGLLVPGRGGEGGICYVQSSPPCATAIDQLVLGSDAVSAVHLTIRDANCEPVRTR